MQIGDIACRIQCHWMEKEFFYSFLLPYRTVFTSCFFRINTAELKNSRLGKWIDVLRWYKWGMTLQLWAPSWQTLCPQKWPTKMNIYIYIIMMRKYIKMMDNHEVFWTTVDSWWALPDISSSVSAQHPPYSALSGPKIVFSSAGVSRG